MGLLRTVVYGTSVRIGTCIVSFQRTLRVPEQSEAPYPLPPTFGPLPLLAMGRKPARVGIPMYQREAMWMAFESNRRPCAVLVGSGGINVISGLPWKVELRRDPQNYIVCPEQPWLDGFNSGAGFVRQFVAMPAGLGYTVSEQLAGADRPESLRIVVYEGKEDLKQARLAKGAAQVPLSLGLAAGGKIAQRIYQDPYPKKMWDPDRTGTLEARLLTIEEYVMLSGAPAPPTPVDPAKYAAAGLPWFEFYDEGGTDLAPSNQLARLKSPDEVAGRESQSIEVKPESVRRIRRKT